MPAAIPLIGLAVSAGTSIYSASQASKRAKQAQKQIDNYQRQDLGNPYEDTQVSTLGADRQREDMARTMATYSNAASLGGSRAILGLSTNLIAQQNAQEAQIMANLDEQEKQRQMAIAGGGMQVQGMQEQRENNDLLGLGSALQTARAERQDAYNNIAKSAMSAATMAMYNNANKASAKTTTPVDPVNATPPTAETAPSGYSANNAALPNSVSTFNFSPYSAYGSNIFQTPKWIMGLNGTHNPFLIQQ